MRVLILRALKLGDFLTGIPAYRAIRRAYPEAHISLAAPRELEPLVRLLDGVIDDVIHTRDLAPLPARANDYDVGIDLHGAGPASHRLLLAARARRLIAFRNDEIPQSSLGATHRADEHEVARWCRLLATAGIPADASDLDLRAPAIPIPAHVRGATLLHPGAASESRRWPIARWIEVARAEISRGRQIVITGGAHEADRAAEIATAAAIPEAQLFAGRTDAAELAMLVSAAGRVVCGDTGVAHLATAYHRPSVLLFGPTPPAHWGPPIRPYHIVLWNGTTGDPHGDAVDPGLAGISAARAIEALAALPDSLQRESDDSKATRHVA